MKLLLVAGTFPPGRCGIGDYAFRLAQGLASRGNIQVGVLTQGAPERAALNGVEVFGDAAGWRVTELPRLVRRIRAWKPDIAHFHWPSQGFGARIAPALLSMLVKLMGVRVVHTWHEPWLRRDALRYFLQRPSIDGLLFVRPNLEAMMPRSLLRFMPRVPKRTIASAGALPVSTLSGEARAGLREAKLHGRKALVVFFGFLYPGKGIELLFDIADPEQHALVIAGTAPDPAYRAHLETAARSRGWGEQLQFTGYLEAQEAAQLLHAADAVVLPFTAGGGEWNTSIHAALAQGTLVVTTSTQPRGDEPQRNLYTAAIGDVAEMRSALENLAGRRVAPAADDGWTRIASEHAEFYNLVLQARASN